MEPVLTALFRLLYNLKDISVSEIVKHYVERNVYDPFLGVRIKYKYEFCTSQFCLERF